MRIVIGIDDSPQASVGAKWVAELPLTAADEVRVASIVERPVVIGPWGYIQTDVTARYLAEAWEGAQDRARLAAEEAAAACAAMPCQVRVVVREGHPIDGLVRLVQEVGADLVVVGPHGRGRLESILLGSVSQALLHAMPASVLIAREPVSAPLRVLLATDGSPHSLDAALYLARFPLTPQARIEVLTAICAWSGGYAEYGAADLRDVVAHERRRAVEVIDAALEALEAGGKTGTPLIRHGDPKREILAAARELAADLIVTGARGVGGFRGLVLGSVSRAVSKAAPCSTLVVAHGAASTT